MRALKEQAASFKKSFDGRCLKVQAEEAALTETIKADELRKQTLLLQFNELAQMKAALQLGEKNSDKEALKQEFLAQFSNQVSNLDRKSLKELSFFTNPPQRITLVAQELLIVLQDPNRFKPFDWAFAKKHLKDLRLVQKLLDFDPMQTKLTQADLSLFHNTLAKLTVGEVFNTSSAACQLHDVLATALKFCVSFHHTGEADSTFDKEKNQAKIKELDQQIKENQDLVTKLGKEIDSNLAARNEITDTRQRWQFVVELLEKEQEGLLLPADNSPSDVILQASLFAEANPLTSSYVLVSAAGLLRDFLRAFYSADQAIFCASDCPHFRGKLLHAARAGLAFVVEGVAGLDSAVRSLACGRPGELLAEGRSLEVDPGFRLILLADKPDRLALPVHLRSFFKFIEVAPDFERLAYLLLAKSELEKTCPSTNLKITQLLQASDSLARAVLELSPDGGLLDLLDDRVFRGLAAETVQQVDRCRALWDSINKNSVSSSTIGEFAGKNKQAFAQICSFFEAIQAPELREHFQALRAALLSAVGKAVRGLALKLQQNSFTPGELDLIALARKTPGASETAEIFASHFREEFLERARHILPAELLAALAETAKLERGSTGINPTSSFLAFQTPVSSPGAWPQQSADWRAELKAEVQASLQLLEPLADLKPAASDVPLHRLLNKEIVLAANCTKAVVSDLQDLQRALGADRSLDSYLTGLAQQLYSKHVPARWLRFDTFTAAPVNRLPDWLHYLVQKVKQLGSFGSDKAWPKSQSVWLPGFYDASALLDALASLDLSEAERAAEPRRPVLVSGRGEGEAIKIRGLDLWADACTRSPKTSSCYELVSELCKEKSGRADYQVPVYSASDRKELLFSITVRLD